MSANLKKDPITTIAGAVLLGLALYIIFDSYQNEQFKTWKDFLLPLGCLVTAVFLIKSPDSIVKLTSRAVDKKIGKKEGE